MFPCNLELFPLFSTFPVSYIVLQFLKQFEYKVLHTRYQVPFYLWDIKLVWGFLKNRKYFEQNCSSLIWSSFCFTALRESLERSSNIPVRRHVISPAQLCLPKPLFCLNLLNYFIHIFFDPFSETFSLSSLLSEAFSNCLLKFLHCDAVSFSRVWLSFILRAFKQIED